MTHRPIALGLALATLLGCTGDDESRCGERNDEGSLIASDSHNYAFDGSLEVASQDVAIQIETCINDLDDDEDGTIDELDECIDITFEWSDVTYDLQGHEMDAVDDVDNVALVLFRYLSQDEVEEKLSTNALVQADVGLYVATDPGDETSVQLSELTLLGNEIGPHQYLEEDAGTFLLTLQKGNVVGVGYSMTQFVRPTVDSTETTVTVTNESTVLDYTVDLTSADPLRVNSGTDVEIDWAQLTTDGLGLDFDFTAVDRLMIARYQDLTLEDLEANFLDIELLADDIYNLDLGTESTVNLEEASGDSGSFPGLDDSSTWLFALRCTSCANPAPLFLTSLQLCSED
jgi:hypothetical protein